MAVETLFERYGARKHERLAGYEFDCEQCGSAFYRKRCEVEALVRRWETPQKPNAGTGKTFCSRVCSDEFWSQHRFRGVCQHCGAEVVRPPSQIKQSVFCSKECTESYGLVSIRCCWPGCDCQMQARTFVSKKHGPTWKTTLTRKGTYARNPLCDTHIALIREHLPDTARVQNGRAHWLSDPEKDLGTRGVTTGYVKLMVWSKTSGRCIACACTLPFNQKPRLWHIDHVVPVFKGGLTTFSNLMPMCADCHRVKSGLEKSEARRTRHREHKSRRWLTHPEKDALIASLRSENDLLRLELAKVRSGRHDKEEGQCRRVLRQTRGLRPRRPDQKGDQGSLDLRC